MIQIIPSDRRHHDQTDWLSTYWHFSFSDYYDPANLNWGPLRVFNDDVIQPEQGFGMHPHRDMEIISYVLEGRLQHQDHLGNRGIVHAGEVQVMSAGKGIMHAEKNPSADTPVHLLQIWIMPRKKSSPPRWEQRKFNKDQRRGKLLPVVSSGETPDTLTIDQDATIYISSLPAGHSIQQPMTARRRGYLFLIGGRIQLNGLSLHPGDQARIADETQLEIHSESDAELIFLDLPYEPTST